MAGPFRRIEQGPHRLDASWADRRIGFAVALGIVMAFAVVSGLVAPRGPVTTSGAVVSIGAGVLVGALAGLVAGSRLMVVGGPFAYIVAFEIGRLDVPGPTVDGIELGSTYGLIAFVVGRLWHGVLALAPLATGAVVGVWLAHRTGHPRATPLGIAGRIGSVVAAVALVALVASLVQPAATPSIRGPDGRPLPGSVAEIVELPIGGHDQTVMIRGRSASNPVLLYLAGGPGGTDLGAMRADTSLEQDFVVVTWEQRGAGKSYAALDPVATLTVDQMIADTIELTDHLRDRFGHDRIYLVGNSWGTLLGVLAARDHPDRFHAFVGTGQMVSPRDTDRMFWEDTLAWAERIGDRALAAELRANGPPPYDDLLDYEPALSHEHDWNPYPELDLSREMPANLLVAENSLMDRVNGLRAFLDTFSVLYPQLQTIDLRRDAPTLEVPIVLVIGEHEARGRLEPALAWFRMLEAPAKRWITLERAGHRPLFEEPAAFAAVMRALAAGARLPA